MIFQDILSTRNTHLVVYTQYRIILGMMFANYKLPLCPFT